MRNGGGPVQATGREGGYSREGRERERESHPHTPKCPASTHPLRSRPFAMPVVLPRGRGRAGRQAFATRAVPARVSCSLAARCGQRPVSSPRRMRIGDRSDNAPRSAARSCIFWHCIARYLACIHIRVVKARDAWMHAVQFVRRESRTSTSLSVSDWTVPAVTRPTIPSGRCSLPRKNR